MPYDTQHNFDGLAWLNHRFAEAGIDFAEVRPVLSFSLLWNLFESAACQRNANPASIKKSVDEADLHGKITPEDYEPYVNFFRDRYLVNGQVNDFFMRQLLTNPDHRETVERTLRGERRDVNNMVYSLLLIAHRIRNNLFHGNKELSQLPYQLTLFTVINNLLADYIEDIGR